MNAKKPVIAIINDEPRTCEEIHKQIEGHLRMRPKSSFKCQKCEKLFRIASQLIQER